MKKILLFSHDPGGANTIIPLIRPLRERSYSVLLYGDGTALERYQRAGVEGRSISASTGSISQHAMVSFLKDQQPDFVITATSANDFTERYLWQAAEGLGITSFAIMDQWINYGIRFSPWGLINSSCYEEAPVHPFLPSRVIVMDEYAKQEMVFARIIPAKRILPLGQPYFETLAQRAAELPARSQLRASLDLPDDAYMITFVSEPVLQDYGVDSDTISHWGFTEHTVLTSLLAGLEKVTKQIGTSVHLVIKLHPREPADNYSALTATGHSLITISTDRDSDPFHLIHASDLLCGMSSMMLIEAALFSKPIISIMIGLRRESPFILERRGLVSSVRDEAALHDRLLAELSGLAAESVVFDVQRYPVKAIIAEMERMIAR